MWIAGSFIPTLSFFCYSESFNSNDDWGETHPQTWCLINDSQMLCEGHGEPATKKSKPKLGILMMEIT